MVWVSVEGMRVWVSEEGSGCSMLEGMMVWRSKEGMMVNSLLTILKDILNCS